jgi:Lar family restriction alleviation protein
MRDRIEYYRKVGNEYVRIENPSDELKAMFTPPPPGFGTCAAVVTEEKIPESDDAYARATKAIGATTLSMEEGKRIIAFVEGAIHGGLNPAQPIRVPREIEDLAYEIGSGLHSDCQSGVDAANAALAEAFERGWNLGRGVIKSVPIWTGIDKDKRSNGFDDYLREGEPYIPNRSPLSPCPFCGAGNTSLHIKPLLIVEDGMDDVQIVSCKNCGASGPRGKTSVESVMRWNTGTRGIRNKK